YIGLVLGLLVISPPARILEQPMIRRFLALFAQSVSKVTRMAGMFSFLGRVIVNRPYLICAGWVVLAIGLWVVATAWHSKAEDDATRLQPGRCPSVRGYQLREKAFPQEVFASKGVFVVEREKKPLLPKDYALVDCMAAELEALRREQPGLKIGNI